MMRGKYTDLMLLCVESKRNLKLNYFRPATVQNDIHILNTKKKPVSPQASSIMELGVSNGCKGSSIFT